METKQATYLDFLGTANTKMTIPVFQRVYTWGVWQCEELWEDIVRAGKSDSQHFIGSIIYTHEPQDGTAGVDQLYNIVDGQQRTTTVTLLLVALRDHLREVGGTAGGMNAEAIEKTYLVISGADGSSTMKFTAAPADQETYAAVLNKTELPVSYKISSCILDNYQYFKDQIDAGQDPDELMRGLRHLFAIIVKLDGDDNPQLIFEGINSKGMSLATRDLLRNKLFYGNDEATQERLLDTYWEPLEAVFENDKDQKQLNAALRCWLCDKDPELAKHTPYELYSVFRKYITERYEGTTEELMAELLEHCKYFRSMLKSPPMKKHLDWAEGETSIGFVLKVS